MAPVTVATMKDCIDCLWVDRFIRQGGKRPLHARDWSFLTYLQYRLARDSQLNPRDALKRRLLAIKTNLRTLLPFVYNAPLGLLQWQLRKDIELVPVVLLHRAAEWYIRSKYLTKSGRCKCGGHDYADLARILAPVVSTDGTEIIFPGVDETFIIGDVGANDIIISG